MRKVAGLFAAGLLTAVALTVPPVADAQNAQDAPQILTRQFDGERSDVGFELRILLRNLSGRFLSLRGELRIDKARDQADIDVVLDSNSVWMAKESNAQYARSAEFFDAGRYPHIRFRAAAISPSLFSEGGSLHGTVTLRGVTRPMVLTVDPADCEHPGDDCDVLARGSVDRSNFGMTSKTLFVGKRVDLNFRIRLRPLDVMDTSAVSRKDVGASR